MVKLDSEFRIYIDAKQSSSLTNENNGVVEYSIVGMNICNVPRNAGVVKLHIGAAIQLRSGTIDSSIGSTQACRLKAPRTCLHEGYSTIARHRHWRQQLRQSGRGCPTAPGMVFSTL
jgi:hypothetical protein